MNVHPQPPHPPEATRRKGRRTTLIISSVLVATLLVTIGVLTLFYRSSSPSPSHSPSPTIELPQAEAGQCVTDPSHGNGMVVDCSSDHAKYRLLARAERLNDCAAVAGAESAYADYSTKHETGEDLIWCMSRADSDLSQEINTIAAGDCVTVQEKPDDGEDDGDNVTALRSECVSGTYPVQDVEQGVSRTFSNNNGSLSALACTKTRGTTETAVGWSLERIIPPKGDPGARHRFEIAFAKDKYDLLLCLGPQNG